MKIEFQYRSGVLTLPGEVLSALDSASDEDLRVLLLLADKPGSEVGEKALAEAAGCSPARVRRALNFWKQVGVIATGTVGTETAATETVGAKTTVAAAATVATEATVAVFDAGKTDAETQPDGRVTADGSVKTVTAPVPPTGDMKTSESKPLRRADELPDYTTTELAAILEKRRDLAMLVEECQRAWGKVFNTHEANVVIGLIEYLGFDGEYILVLLNYCAKQNVRSLHSAERLAYRMHDDGVVTVDALQERLCRMEAAHGAEGMIRSMFGLGSRSFTEKEKAQIDLWINTYRFGEDVIRRAYEITVNVKSKPSINYAGGILKRWYEAGLDTPEKIDRAETERRAENASALGAGSGAGDDFWEAAVRASYGKDFERLGFGKQTEKDKQGK